MAARGVVALALNWAWAIDIRIVYARKLATQARNVASHYQRSEMA